MFKERKFNRRKLRLMSLVHRTCASESHSHGQGKVSRSEKGDKSGTEPEARFQATRYVWRANVAQLWTSHG